MGAQVTKEKAQGVKDADARVLESEKKIIEEQARANRTKAEAHASKMKHVQLQEDLKKETVKAHALHQDLSALQARHPEVEEQLHVIEKVIEISVKYMHRAQRSRNKLRRKAQQLKMKSSMLEKRLQDGKINDNDVNKEL